jgi:hypothetical protein
MKHLKFLLFCLFIFNNGYCQVDNYVYDLSRLSKEERTNKLFELITKSPKKQNIYLLSDAYHYCEIEEIRKGLTFEFIKKIKPGKIYVELPAILKEFILAILDNKINVADYKDTMMSKFYEYKLSMPDSLNFPKYNYFLEEVEIVKSGKLTATVKAIRDMGYIDNYEFLDVGTDLIFAELFYLRKITKEKNITNDAIINNYLDSLRVRYDGTFHGYAPMLGYKSIHNIAAIRKSHETFLSSLKRNINDSLLIKKWVNATIGLYNTPYTLDDVKRHIVEGAVKSFDEITQSLSFRDSVVYLNFLESIPKEWQNLVINYSTYHLMDSKEFTDVLPEHINTFGRYLNKDFKPYLKKIAFLCYNQIPGGKNLSNRKKSLEAQLAKKYNYAYIDLSEYKQRNLIKYTPFFLMPTFSRYIKYNWEDIFDGIVFIKDCNCAIR